MKKTILTSIFLVSFCFQAIAQVPNAGPMVPNGTGGSGSGSVTSIATACGVSGGPITSTGTIQGNAATNAQTGTTYTLASSDCGKFVTFSNAASIAVTIPIASTSGFGAGYFTTLINEGAGTLTMTPTTSTIDGAASLTLTTNQSVDLYSDGTNYFTGRGRGGGSGTVTTTGSPASGNLTKFSGATSITSGDLSGDCATSGTLSVSCNGSLTPSYVASNWYLPYGIGTPIAGASTAASTIRCFMGGVAKPIHVTTLGILVTTGVAATNAQLAIYSDSGGRPGALIASTASIPTTTSSAVANGTITNTALGPGTANGSNIWWCDNTDSSSTLFQSVNSTSFEPSLIGSATEASVLNALGGNITGISCSGASCNGGSSTFGTWPASLTGSTWTDITTARTPIVAFQVNSIP